MKTLPILLGFALCLTLASCSSFTTLRTKEIDASVSKVNVRIDSLIQIIDSLKFEQNRNASRLKADMADLNSKVSEQGDKSEARMEEINYRLDRLLSIAQQKSVVTKSAAGSSATTAETKASLETEALYNASRADYLRAEYAVAYNGFKQIYETEKTGEMAENSLYWMAMCMLDAQKRENAQTLFKSLLEKFPQSIKVCSVNFKLASMAEEDNNKADQKAYLQKLLETQFCASSNEFQRAAEILQSLQ